MFILCFWIVGMMSGSSGCGKSKSKSSGSSGCSSGKKIRIKYTVLPQKVSYSSDDFDVKYWEQRKNEREMFGTRIE